MTRLALAVAVAVGLSACGGPDEDGCVTVASAAPDGSTVYETVCPAPVPLSERADRAHQPVYTTH